VYQVSSWPVQDASAEESADAGAATQRVDASASADGAGPGKPAAADMQMRQRARAATGTMAVDEQRASLAKAASTKVERSQRRWPGQRVVGPVIGCASHCVVTCCAVGCSVAIRIPDSMKTPALWVEGRRQMCAGTGFLLPCQL